MIKLGIIFDIATNMFLMMFRFADLIFSMQWLVDKGYGNTELQSLV